MPLAARSEVPAVHGYHVEPIPVAVEGVVGSPEFWGGDSGAAEHVAPSGLWSGTWWIPFSGNLSAEASAHCSHDVRRRVVESREQ